MHRSNSLNHPRAIRISAIVSLALAMLLTMASAAQASHFRFGHNTWRKISGNTVEFTFLQAWREFADDQLCVDFGDSSGSCAAGTLIGHFTDVAGEGYNVFEYKQQHTYASEGPFLAFGESCCRIGSLVNAANGSERIETVVDLRSGNQGSPVSSIPIIVQFVRGGVNTFNLPISDPDGDPYACRMATNPESLIASVASAGGQSLSVSSNCMLSWDTSSTTVGQKYAAQVIIEENHGGNFSRVALDFIIEIIDGTINQRPTCSGTSGSHVVNVGQTFNGSFTGSDPEGGNLTLGHLGLPPGATLSPPATTSQASPFMSSFAWTPQASDLGSAYSITILYTDTGNLSSTCSLSLRVPLCGDGVIDPAAGEACDPAAQPSGCAGNDVCTSGCQCQPPQTCGNGTIEAGEDCDPGSAQGNGVVPSNDCCDAASCRYKTPGTTCSTDQNDCTNDQCAANGVCGHTPNTAPCDDGLFCTVNDTCGNGSCGQGATRDCGSSMPCNIASCDEANDVCVTTPDPQQNGQPCSNGNACTVGQSCSNGSCGGGTATDCDDNNACTTDTCDALEGGCSHAVEVESPACGSCDDGIDNDEDGLVDGEEQEGGMCTCTTLCKQFRFAATVTLAPANPKRFTTYTGSDVTFAGSPLIAGSTHAGFCGTNAAIRAGGEFGIFAVTGSTDFGKGATLDPSLDDPDANVDPDGVRNIDIREEFASDGGNERIRTVAPLVGPGMCSNNAAQMCGGNSDCGAGNSCDGRGRLDTPGNTYVSRDGTADNFGRCVDALAAVPGEATLLSSFAGTVPGYDDGSTEIKTSGGVSLLSINVGAGQQVIHVRRVIIAGKTVIQLIGTPTTNLLIRVDRTLRMGGEAEVVLAGGLTPDRVIWLADGSSGGRPKLLRSSKFKGTLIAPNRRGILVGGLVTIDGALKGQRLHLGQGSRINHMPFSSLLM